jgi:DNA invertase Pin-like site-specific DNA recombinase
MAIPGRSDVSWEIRTCSLTSECSASAAVKKGWTVAEEHIYSDDDISGAEFAKRPGFLRLMNALKPRPAFQVLIMSEESRLGREQIDTAYALKQITDAGVRVFFYLEDRERTLDSAMDKVMLSLTNFAAEVERERARQRTYDAMARKARALHVTGGRFSRMTTSTFPRLRANGRTSYVRSTRRKPTSFAASSASTRKASAW